ncbi:Altered inheritance of mitochondria protein 6 [Elasticomyces elasticus]|nr:Altered inheritance of mitochondria protein 6 [Elasticomyces elasticus]KAK4912499.1 Altered inheritance of mitochondria protein 6 [Elasticomyces elasticus]KAK5751865.1 Altered inheritance of mitochondria protein 6 [Elasticomyces elasticus]
MIVGGTSHCSMRSGGAVLALKPISGSLKGPWFDRSLTFETLYVNTLSELLNKSGNAVYPERSYTHRVYDSNPAQTLILLLDVKRADQDASVVVHKQLQPLRDGDYLSYWDGQEFRSRVVTVVGTGKTPWESVVSHNPYRDIFFDAPLRALWEEPRSPIDSDDPLHIKDGDIDYGEAMCLSQDDGTLKEAKSGARTLGDRDMYNTSTSYYASTDVASSVGFPWEGAPLAQRDAHYSRLDTRAKRKGLKARYWGTPLWPTALRDHVCHVLVKNGADVLNVDDLEAAARQDWSSTVHDLAPRLQRPSETGHCNRLSFY